MREHKYVIAEDEDGSPHVMLFDARLVHKYVWAGARRSYRTMGAELKPVSAGFFYPGDSATRASAWGRSDSLDLDSHEDDTQLIQAFLLQVKHD